MKRVEVIAAESAPAAGHRLSLGDIFRYAALLEEVVAIWAAVHSLAVGADVAVPDIKVKLGGAHYTWHGGHITRDS